MPLNRRIKGRLGYIPGRSRGWEAVWLVDSGFRQNGAGAKNQRH